MVLNFLEFLKFLEVLKSLKFLKNWALNLRILGPEPKDIGP